MTTGIIGCGALGETLIHALQKQQVATILVSARNNSRLVDLKEKYRVEITKDNRTVVEKCKEVYLCVKPGQAQVVCEEIRGAFRSDILLVSVMAGIPIKSIVKWTGHVNVVKIMPTITLTEGGPIPIAGHRSSNLHLPSENLIYMTEEQVNLSTAISGCMPGFLAYILQEWIGAAVNQGMEKDLAEKLVLQNFVSLAATKPKNVEELIEIQRLVTSKGGATEQGIEALKKIRLDEGLNDMIVAANNRVNEIVRMHE